MKILRYVLPLLFLSASAHALSIQQNGIGNQAISVTTMKAQTANITGSAVVGSTLSVAGNSFSVGGSSFTVNGGTTTADGKWFTVTASTGYLTSPFTYIQGRTDGGIAPPGYVGEISSGVLAGAQNPSTSGTLVAISTITLSPGDWDVIGYCEINSGATTAATSAGCGISTSNTSFDVNNANNRTDVSFTFAVSLTNGLKVGPRFVNVSVSTTYYLITQLTYTTLGGATFGVDSIIQARRVR